MSFDWSHELDDALDAKTLARQVAQAARASVAAGIVKYALGPYSLSEKDTCIIDERLLFVCIWYVDSIARDFDFTFRLCDSDVDQVARTDTWTNIQYVNVQLSIGRLVLILRASDEED